MKDSLAGLSRLSSLREANVIIARIGAFVKKNLIWGIIGAIVGFIAHRVWGG